METVLKNVFKNYLAIQHKDFCELKKTIDDDGLFLIFDNRNFKEHSQWNYLKTYNDEKTFVENFGNPSYSVSRTIQTLVIEKNDEKVSLKIFLNTKTRQAGKVFFNKGTAVHYLTYNIKTGNLYSGHIINHHKKRKFSKSVRCNEFFKSPVNKFFIKLKSDLSRTIDKDSDIVLSSLVINYYKTFTKLLGVDPSSYQTLDEELFKRNLLKKGFKISDNFEKFIKIYPLLTKKESIKNNNKFIDCVLNRVGLKGKRFRKIFHELKSFNNYAFNNMVNHFGVELIKSLPDDCIKNIFESDMESLITYGNVVEISVEEKNILFNNKSFVECLKLSISGSINFCSLLDHIRFYLKLNKYEPTIWRAKDIKSFNNEHIEYSERIEYFSNGTYHRIYDPKFVQEIEKPIGDFYPVVLNDTKSYVDESTNQQNCVRTYIKRPRSFIVSLRHNEERASLEYNIWEDWKYMSTQKRVYMKRVQSLGRFNKSLDEKWNIVLKKLDERIDQYLNNNEFILPKIRVTFNNGEQFETDLTFIESGIAVWNKNKSKLDLNESPNNHYLFDNPF
jgi:hypothetical protein